MVNLRPVLYKDFEDKKALEGINKIFNEKRGYAFKMPKRGSSVIIQISGGLDSITIWNILLAKYHLHVYPVHFLNRKKTFLGEEESVRHYSRVFKNLYPDKFHEPKIIEAPSTNRVNVPNVNFINPKIILNNLLFNKKINKYQVLLNYGDNPLYERFFNVYNYAQQLRATVARDLDTIITNFVAEDSTISRNSTLAVLRSINLSLCLMLGDFSWQFTAPLEKGSGFYYGKTQLIKYAHTKGVDLSHSWSCMFRGKRQCGECATCLIRREAFSKAHVKDRTMYVPIRKRRSLGIRSYIRKTLANLFEGFGKKTTRRIGSGNVRFNGGSVIVLSKDVAWEEIDGKVNLLHSKTGEIDILNQSGSLIWEYLSQGKYSFNELYSMLSKKYGTKNAPIKKDLEKFIIKYIKEGYLTVS